MQDVEVPAAPISRRERNNRERRARLLAEGRRLFDAQGVDATTMEQIALAAGLSARTVYNFFPTKLDLLAATLSAELRARLGTSTPAEIVAGESPAESVLAIAKVLVATLSAIPKAEQQMVAARALLAEADSDAVRYVGEIDTLIGDALHRRLERFGDAGLLRPGTDPAETAELIFATLNGLHLAWLQNNSDLEEILPKLHRLLEAVLG